MAKIEFHVCWYRLEARWAVRQGIEMCRTYPTREEAIRGAAELAAAAQEAGQDAVVVSDLPRTS
jgi:broad specificity phosphatase PhoE